MNIKSVLQDILQTNKEKIKVQKARLPRHNANTTTTKEREKETKTKEMPKPNIPYSPNDYWDRTRFSSASDKSPSHSIASLPHHPPALSITSTSPSRNNEIPPPSSRGRSSQRTYAQELQLRSRSPKLFELRPQDKGDTSKNGDGDGGRDPATRLGGFRAVNPRTSRVGDQELPWKLSIPGDTSPGTSDAAAAAAAADADTGDGSDKHPQRGQIPAINEGKAPVELPGHKDNDDEEIVMSSTAYPGQEWRPDGLSQWESW